MIAVDRETIRPGGLADDHDDQFSLNIGGRNACIVADDGHRRTLLCSCRFVRIFDCRIEDITGVGIASQSLVSSQKGGIEAGIGHGTNRDDRDQPADQQGARRQFLAPSSVADRNFPDEKRWQKAQQKKIKKQIPAEVEYCFIDDGSRDRTLPILRELNKKSGGVRTLPVFFP